ncbi:nicotinate-nucleotide--dimethylbenzimidazole phosphoribosyltransferase [Streptomyces sp. SAI-127]|uniref:nicotinate-nucleotide--dimethylbenzimidazole phosphoribosyltransferase n=1 Tax=Streptomyces sp. SAI-127 TaxID=2940543 RepID=UPI002475E6CC|nr:nicotinate-nucleotide--dimethylbenzimidazole phosphoribosyltransferase [Streptomyces sp. SAI-127]MDH6491723.1 nicotinate-nucleotide--dimethylbenzimidazole phosphoribosyltransferase [Streptomyces sp. SAI-127]
MTDTGQVPGDGLAENAGTVEQPGVPGAYTYLSETTAEDEDLLLLPGAQSPWGNEVAPPAPEPVVETVHEPGPHEMSGRDSGAHDLSAVRTPQQQAPSTPIPPITPRRPLHLGPPIPDASASPVRSLADRGPAGAPVRQPAAAMPGPEYFDVPQPQGAVPWGAPAQAAVQTPVSTVAPAAETVVPAQEPVGSAQAAVPPLASEAEAVGYEVPETPAPDAVEAPEAPEAVYAPEPVQTPVAEAGQVLADGSGADGVQPDGGEGQLPADGSLPDGVQLAPASAEMPAEQVLADGPVAEAVQDAGAEAEQALANGLVVGATEDAVAVADAVDAAEAEPVPVPVPVVEASAAAADADATTPVAEEVVAEPEAVAVQEAVASEAVTAEDAETGTAQEADASQEAVVAPEVEAVLEEAAPLVGEDVVLQAPVEAEQVPQPMDAVTAPDEVPSPPAEDDPAAEIPEPLAVEEAAPAEQAAPAPEWTQEPVPAALPAEVPQAPHLVPAPDPVQPAPQGPVGGPADTSAQEAPEPLAADVADIDVQAMEPAAPADELQPSDPVAQEGFPAAPDQAPQGPQTPAAQPLAAELADAQTQFAYPAAAEAPAVLPAQVPLEPRTGEPLGEFVPVDGSVPTTPHLAPTPPHPLSLPTDDAQQPVVPAPREAVGDPEPAQQADDLDTRAADQEDHEVQEVQEEVSTAAVEEVRQSTGPAAPAYDDAEREAVLKVMRERRDIRNGFRGDPIPHEVLLRVLEAAHTAPSVGHSQPWDFVVIRSAETRAAMQDLAQRQRDAYAKSLPKGRAKQFKELKIEAILETPVNIVVTADPTRGGRHTLGRHTQPQMAPYSAALAVENLWLAARAEGLGVGWVSFFDEREMVRALGLPEHLEVIAYLCVGYVDEFPDEPELMQAGWSKRRPLSWVVHEETYGRRALPGEEPHDLLGETVAQIRPLDAKALGEAWERQKRMTKPAGALGMLEIISAQLSGLSRQCPPPIPEPAAVAIFAGDHGVHAQGVTPWPQEVTAQMVANFLGGGAVCNAFAAQVGAEVCVVDVGVASELPATPGLLPRKVRAGTSDMTTGLAMTREEAKQAIEVGIETARDLVAAGNKALLTGEMGIANTTASAALISVFTGTDPADVTGRGTGINDETLARKTEVVRRAIELHQPDPADPIGVLAAIGGFEHAAMVGLLLGGASLRTPVILDGVSAGAAALVARAIAPEVLAACIAGHRSAEPGHVAALNKLGLRPLVDLDLRLGEGTGALLALPLVQSTARAMHEVATFDSAGVTEK